jgi:hypothetical protein
MQVCTTYSKSHRVFFTDFFIKTFPDNPNLKLHVEQMPQSCPTGWLFASGWRAQMVKKDTFIIKCLKLFSTDLLLFSDVDVAFYEKRLDKDLEACLGDNDIAFMKDHGDDFNGRSAGFWVAKPNDKIISLFETVVDNLKKHEESEDKTVAFKNSEQGTLNQELAKRDDINWDYLPERYYTHGKYVNGVSKERLPHGKWWDQKTEEEKLNVFIPNNLYVHHANWCCGTEAKIDLLNFVKERRNYEK